MVVLQHINKGLVNVQPPKASLSGGSQFELLEVSSPLGEEVLDHLKLVRWAYPNAVFGGRGACLLELKLLRVGESEILNQKRAQEGIQNYFIGSLDVDSIILILGQGFGPLKHPSLKALFSACA